MYREQRKIGSTERQFPMFYFCKAETIDGILLTEKLDETQKFTTPEVTCLK